MAKTPTLSPIVNISTSAPTINANNARVEAAFGNTLSRDGSGPNQMLADLDLNSHDVLNVDNIHVNGSFVYQGAVLAPTDFFSDEVQNYLGQAEDAADRAEAAAAMAEERGMKFSLASLAALLADTTVYIAGDIIQTRKEGYSYQVMPAGTAQGPAGYHVAMAGGVLLRYLPRDGGTILAAAFGVKADGVTDDTAAFRAAVAYAEWLVRNAATTKQEDGADVMLPKGLTRITDTITVTESNIRIRGISSSASVLYAPDADFDLLVFERPGWALYNCGVSDLRFSTPGNATAGYHLKIMNCIYFIHRNTLFNGWWGGLYIAAGGKVINSNVIWSQEVRNPATPLTGAAITIGAEYAITGDVHFTDCQVMEDINTAGVNSVIIRCGDGIYFNNTHIHGTVLVEPRGTGGETTLSTLVFNACYLDASRDVCLHITGAPTYEYRDVRVENTYVRGGVMGIRVNPTTPIVGLSIRGGTIAQHQYWGIECLNSNIIDMKIDGVTFDDNNKSNFGLVGDIRLNGIGSKVSGCTFTGGKTDGRSIQIDSGSDVAQLRNLSWTNSNVPVAQRVADSGTATAMSALTGYPIRNQGHLTVPNGANVAYIAHGLAFAPPLGAISVTPYGQVPQWWVSDVTATQFTVNFASNLLGDRVIAWAVDVES